MAIDERDIKKILGNQAWAKAALGELLANNATIIANQQTQITTLKSMLTVLEAIRDQHSTEDAMLVDLDGIKQTLEWMLDKM